MQDCLAVYTLHVQNENNSKTFSLKCGQILSAGRSINIKGTFHVFDTDNDKMVKSN